MGSWQKALIWSLAGIIVAMFSFWQVIQYQRIEKVENKTVQLEKEKSSIEKDVQHMKQSLEATKQDVEETREDVKRIDKNLLRLLFKMGVEPEGDE
jgi:peptidoglycan hydrolase CwlO-like protein